MVVRTICGQLDAKDPKATQQLTHMASWRSPRPTEISRGRSLRH